VPPTLSFATRETRFGPCVQSVYRNCGRILPKLWKARFQSQRVRAFVSALNAILRLTALLGNVIIEARTACGQSASEYRPYLPRQRWVRTANDTSLQLLERVSSGSARSTWM